jgi:SAM-dependent methyltransferase
MGLLLKDVLKDVSPWVERWSHLVAEGASVLDVACGTGRHVRWFASRGCQVTALDRDAAAMASLAGHAAEIVVADIEAIPWPLPGRRFDAVVVTNYLYRPLMPVLVSAVADSGVLIYETFALGQASIGRPSNPEFLLRPGELLAVVKPMRVVAFEDGYDAGPTTDAKGGAPSLLTRPCVLPPVNRTMSAPGSIERSAQRFVQRIVAVRTSPITSAASLDPPRYPLRSGPGASG